MQDLSSVPVATPSRQNLSFIKRWFGRTGARRASEQLDAQPPSSSQEFELGRRYALGEGVERDQAQAVAWLLKAAEKGHLEAEYHLGLIYAQGQGVFRDHAKASFWLSKAAKSGHPGAQYQVGIRLYRSSQSVTATGASEARVEALEWLERASAQGHHAADSACEFVALSMTKEEVDLAGVRASTRIESSPAGAH